MSVIATPFRFTAFGSVLTTGSLDQLIKQKVIDILTTGPLERVMRPGYGANAYGMLFEPLDDLISVDFEADALSMINKHLSEGQVVSLKVRRASGVGAYNTSIDQPGVLISVMYKIPPFDTRQFSFVVANPDTLTEETSL